jgi:8-oxo-dGTP pyrophosphatase MutT (NUDIX family)
MATDPERTRVRRAALSPMFDPKSQPWEVSSSTYGIVPPEVLDPDFVRTVLQGGIERPLELPNEALIQYPGREGAPVEAAVLVPMVMRQGGLTVLLTQRTDHLHDHAGQVSFPGGRVEKDDLGPVATALRETHEETGLAPEHVDVIGHLPRYFTATGFAITPVTSLVRPNFSLSPDKFEVAHVFEVPLSFLTDPRNYRFHEARLPDGSVRRYYSVPWGDFFIWGATAAMLRGMYQILAEAFSSSRRR